MTAGQLCARVRRLTKAPGALWVLRYLWSGDSEARVGSRGGGGVLVRGGACPGAQGLSAAGVMAGGVARPPGPPGGDFDLSILGV